MKSVADAGYRGYLHGLERNALQTMDKRPFSVFFKMDGVTSQHRLYSGGVKCQLKKIHAEFGTMDLNNLWWSVFDVVHHNLSAIHTGWNSHFCFERSQGILEIFWNIMYIYLYVYIYMFDRLIGADVEEIFFLRCKSHGFPCWNLTCEVEQQGICDPRYRSRVTKHQWGTDFFHSKYSWGWS